MLWQNLGLTKEQLSPGKAFTCLLTFFSQFSFMASFKGKVVILLLVLNFTAVALKHKQK